MFANFDLAKRKCKHCGNMLIKKMKTQKFCSDECQKKHQQKKNTTYTKNIEKNIKTILGNKCFLCDFDTIVEIHCLDGKTETTHKILQAYNKKNMHEYVLLCPNHHQMIHQKLATLKYSHSKTDELIWEEI
jgi:hypothetical protein